jgi:hypothetical protein
MPDFTLAPAPNGQASTWISRDGEPIGFIQATDRGIRIVLGDMDVGGGPIIVWDEGPCSVQVDLTGLLLEPL